MARCAGTKADGTPCERIIGASQTFCYSHDDTRRAERSKNASTAAKAKLKELHEIKEQLRSLVDDVLKGDLEPRVANTACQALNVRLRAYAEGRNDREFERKLRETDEFEERLAQLEQAQGQKGANWWGV
jgi:hypothetical protein